jgi:hypothetical protein
MQFLKALDRKCRKLQRPRENVNKYFIEVEQIRYKRRPAEDRRMFRMQFSALQIQHLN